MAGLALPRAFLLFLITRSTSSCVNPRVSKTNQNELSFNPSTGCPRKNVPLGEGQTSPKGTFFWDTWYIKPNIVQFDNKTMNNFNT